MNVLKIWNRFLIGTLLFLALLLLLLLETEKKNPATSESLFVTDTPVGDISAVAINRSDDSFGMILHPEGIELLDQESESYSQQKLAALVYKICHLPALRAIPLPSDSNKEFVLAEYGLLYPESFVSQITAEGKTNRIYLGDFHPIDNAQYVKPEQSNTIYLISPKDASMLHQPLSSFRILDLFPSLTSDQSEMLGYIQVTYRGRTWSVLRNADTSGSLYQLSEPVTVPLDWQTVYTKVIEPLFKLTPDTFLSETASLADYKLDTPDITLTVKLDGHEYNSFFSPKDDNSWYCASSYSSQICSIPSELVEFMTQDYMDFLSSSIYSRNLTDISSLTVSEGSTSQTIELNGKLEEQLLADFYKRMTTIPAAGLIDSTETISPEPLMVLTIELKNGQIDILEFLPVSDRQCAVSMNGEIHFSTYTAILQDLLSCFRSFNTKPGYNSSLHQ